MSTIDLKLTGSAYGGESFGRDEDGRMVFVPFALPGETVRVQILDSHKRWARAGMVEVLEPSPDRIEPRCQHFSVCGGCHYQHISYKMQLEWKREILRDQFERIGGFKNPPIRTTVPSTRPWNTRNHIQFTPTVDGALGFMASGTHDVVPIQECHLPLPEIGELWPRIDIEGQLDLDRIILRAGTVGGCLIAFQSEREPDLDMRIDLPASLVWLSPQGVTVIAENEYIGFEVHDHVFRVSARSFFQVNSLLLDSLVQLILEALELKSGQTIFDLYAGVGLFSAFIAQRGAHLIAVEQSPWACKDFEANLHLYEGVTLYEAPVEMALPAIQAQADTILVDPPREGLSKEVRDTVVELAPRRFVYLSCDPATLARDAKQLREAGFRLNSVTPIDLFPQTYHIESLSVFEWSSQR